jgi:hypothetical protein
MKDGICPMCKSREVYMTEKKDNLFIGGGNSLSFEAGEGRESNVFHLDTYVCLNCGYTALLAKAYFHNAESQGLATLKNAKGWKKAG